MSLAYCYKHLIQETGRSFKIICKKVQNITWRTCNTTFDSTPGYTLRSFTCTSEPDNCLIENEKYQLQQQYELPHNFPIYRSLMVLYLKYNF